jgi:hypothetical protein
MYTTSNPIYLRIQRSSGGVWRLTSRLLSGIAGLYILLNLGWFMGISLDVVHEEAYLSGVLSCVLLLLIPVPLAIYTVTLTSRDAASADALLTSPKLAPREVVLGYYEGARKRFTSLVTFLVNLSVASAVLPMLIMAVAHIAPVKFVPAIYLPYMIFYINQMNRIGPSIAIWAALCFRDPGIALMITTGAILAVTLPLIGFYLCSGFLVPLAIITIMPHRFVLMNAEKWV